MLWLLAALASSGLTANNAGMNRRYQQEGFRLNLWRTLLMACFWAPLALIMPWPHELWFYPAAVFSGMATIVGNVVQSRLAAQQNGRVAILYLPLKALLVYLVWLLISPTAWAHLLARPEKPVIVLLCFIVMVMALNAMRRNDASVSALKATLPVVVMYGLGDIFCRMALPAGELADKLVVWLFLTTSASAGVSMLLWHWRPKPEEPVYSSKMLEAAGWAAISGALNNVCFTIALTQAKNPAFVSMIALLAPVWLLVLHKIKGVRDDADPVAGMILVGAALLLVIVTA